jgi:soluble lytic murein transglycosylase
MRLINIALIAAWMIFGPAPQAAALAPADTLLAKAAFKSINRDSWNKARRLGLLIGDDTMARIIYWMDLTRRGSRASFGDISRFMVENPDWPGRALLRRRAEEAMTGKLPPHEALAWFEKHPPVSSDGRARFGAALLGQGDKEKGRAVLKQAWIQGNFTKAREKQFYKSHRKLLTYSDHVRRLDRLLWEGRYWSSRRMMWKVKGADRALAEARFLLRHMLGNVDRAISKVPDELRGDPGLVYERLRWRRRKGRDKSALEILEAAPESPPYLEKWWTERAILARRALDKGNITTAYLLAREHGLEAGADYSEAEWLAGWIALSFLGYEDVAIGHFTAMFKAVKYPISRARGAYWTARAAEASGKAELAELWYRVASSFPIAFYGQLAVAHLKPVSVLKLPPPPAIDAALETAFNAHELTRAVRLLGELGENVRLDPFVKALAGLHDKPGWRSLAASLAQDYGRADLGIWVAKGLSRDGRELMGAGYPALKPVADKSTVEVPLTLAVIRQESAFDPGALSWAGARGLMQLLPRTARKVAKKHGIPYSRRRLTQDPDYNILLGRALLGDLLDEFEGSYVLALAAYNAGPSRARRWIRNNGDPRESSIDVIDWIEMIPFYETRNYVQRILENLQVYRQRLAQTEVAMTLESDLRR